MSVQDEPWFEELGLAAARNSNPENKWGASFVLSPDQVVALVGEIERLNAIESDNKECECGHTYKRHPFDGVISSQFCLDCKGLEDLHNFRLA